MKLIAKRNEPVEFHVDSNQIFWFLSNFFLADNDVPDPKNVVSGARFDTLCPMFASS